MTIDFFATSDSVTLAWRKSHEKPDGTPNESFDNGQRIKAIKTSAAAVRRIKKNNKGDVAINIIGNKDPGRVKIKILKEANCK